MNNKELTTLKEYIQTAQVDQVSLSKLIPCHQSYLSLLVSGKRTPSYRMAKRIEQVTNFKVSRKNWFK